MGSTLKPLEQAADDYLDALRSVTIPPEAAGPVVRGRTAAPSCLAFATAIAIALIVATPWTRPDLVDRHRS
ncbi:hypothetical protein ACPB9E_26790 [Streptomyces exfoliatus]|uniref:hypothetical protein n=1 Tax=Streptomyces exfoliatus TaxID=1905 RepID=UPI003C2D352D